MYLLLNSFKVVVMAFTGEMRLLTKHGYESLATFYKGHVDHKFSLLNSDGLHTFDHVCSSSDYSEIIKIRFCNNTYIRCSFDQKFVVKKDSSELLVSARDLTIGDALPFCQSIANDPHVDVIREKLRTVLIRSDINIDDHLNLVNIKIPNDVVYLDYFIIDLLTVGVVSDVAIDTDITVLQVKGNESVHNLFKIIQWEIHDIDFGSDYDSIIITSVDNDGSAVLYDIPQPRSFDYVIVNGVEARLSDASNN